MEDCVTHKSGVKYANEEDRRKGYLAAQLRYANKKWACEICNRTILISHKSSHLKSKIHFYNYERFLMVRKMA